MITTLVLMALLNSGCSFQEISDWEYEFQYYVDVHTSFPGNYTIMVPLTILPWSYRDEMKVEEGECTFDYVVNDSMSHIRIKGSSNVTISSIFDTNDLAGDAELCTYKDDESAYIYSDSPGISVIVDSRILRKTEEKDHWELRYSTVIDPTKVFPIPTKETWNQRLSEEYFVPLDEGWDLYVISEEAGWEGVEIT